MIEERSRGEWTRGYGASEELYEEEASPRPWQRWRASARRRSAGGSMRPIDRVSRGLGWFSIALGAAELAAPGKLASALGMEGKERLIRAYGARELVSGIGILAVGSDAPWIWARVAGDALDLGTLAQGLDSDNPRRRAVQAAMIAVAGVTALDVVVGQRLVAQARAENGADGDMASAYRDRSGFPKRPQEMRGAARHLAVAQHLRGPEAMRPFGTDSTRRSS